MYIPRHFQMDPKEVGPFLRSHSFGTLVSVAGDAAPSHAGADRASHDSAAGAPHEVSGGPHWTPQATHLPFVYDEANHLLLAHMARANPQWRNLHGQDVLAIFTGPDAYISPLWYDVPDSVPTWNYLAVHVYGTCTVIDDEEELVDVLDQLVRFHEPDSELLQRSDESFYRNMMKAIVGFRIEITEIQAVAKMSQNKSAEVQQRVVDNLGQVGDSKAQAVADWMAGHPKRS